MMQCVCARDNSTLCASFSKALLRIQDPSRLAYSSLLTAGSPIKGTSTNELHCHVRLFVLLVQSVHALGTARHRIREAS